MARAEVAAITLREGGPADAGTVLALVRELADYEKLAHRVVAQEADFAKALDGAAPKIRVVLAEAAGEAVGMALWHETYSTFAGTHGYFLEDFYVRASERGRGIGRALFAHMARRLKAEGGSGIAWRVLDWNAPAIGFYRAIGGTPADAEWIEMRLDGAALAALSA